MEKNQFNKAITRMKLKYKYLTIQELLYRKWIDFSMAFKQKTVDSLSITVPGYTLLTNLTALSAGKSALIGIFMKNETKQKVFIKKYVFQTKGLRYASLMNELATLDLLDRREVLSIPKNNVKIPKLKYVGFKKNELTIICEYYEGEKLGNASSEKKVSIIKKVLDSMTEINKAIKNDLSELPHRSTFVFALSYIYFWLSFTFKYPENLKNNWEMLKLFYVNYFRTRNVTDVYGLVHRDLHSRNIVFNKNDIIITDWEGAIVTDVLYDLAIVAHFYFNEISIDELTSVLKSQLHSETDVRRFIFLSLFYAVQTLSIDRKEYPEVVVTKKFTDVMLHTISPSLLENYV